MDNKNINWINAVKGICMIAVFYVHSMILCGPKIPFASPEIHAFYVNGFFFISGYLLFWKQLTPPKIEENFTEYINKGGYMLLNNIVFRIVIPSILFASLFYLPGRLVKHEEIGVVDFLLETIGGRTFWFTSALVVAELIILLLFLSRKRTIWFYVICLVVIVSLGFFFASINPNTFSLDLWAWRRGVLSLTFLGLGGLYWKYEKWIDKYLLNWYSFVCLFLLMEFIMYFVLVDASELLVSMLTLTPLGIIPGVISVLLLVKMCKMLPASKLLTFVGQNSIGFFFLCSGIPMLLGVGFHKIVSSEPVWGLFVVFAVSLAISYIIVYLLNRLVPWVFDLRKLNKDNRH